MKKSLVLIAAFLLAMTAGTAGAKTLDWHGTLDLDLGALERITFNGSGVATVNNSSGGNHLNTLRIAGGITGAGTIPVTDPETVGTIPSIRVAATLGSGTLAGISGAPPIKPGPGIPLKGFTKVCTLVPGCTTFLPLDNTTNNGNTGVGVGGQLTLGGLGTIRISLVAQPWTIGSTTLPASTHEGAGTIRTVTGFVHGAASGNSSTATNSGVIQLVTPTAVTVAGVAGNSASMTLFTTLTMHFIPEPGLLLLIGSGVLGLGLMGRSRMKK